MPGRRWPGPARRRAAARAGRQPRTRARRSPSSRVGDLGDVERVVFAGVGDAEAAAEVELGQLDAVRRRGCRGQQPDDAGAPRPRNPRCRRSASRCASAARSARAPGWRAPRHAAASAAPDAARSRTSGPRARWRCTRGCAPRPRRVTRTSTRWRAPRPARRSRPAARSPRRSRRRSGRPRARTARRSSASDLLLPWKAIRSAGKPADSATASSPPVQTSSARPSSCDPARHAVHRKALPA